MWENEVPKYKKKKNSSTSDARMKAKHKHSYKECLLVADGTPRRATYCTICGKIGNVNFFEGMKTEQGYYRMLRSDEIFRKYCKLETFEVVDFYQKYAPITSENKKGDV